jgi:hypothetical protein
VPQGLRQLEGVVGRQKESLFSRLTGREAHPHSAFSERFEIHFTPLSLHLCGGNHCSGAQLEAAAYILNARL